jgi:hypothetical protein
VLESAPTISSLGQSPEEPVKKRGRGRPRKHPRPSSSEHAAAEPPKKRVRGRPRKSSTAGLTPLPNKSLSMTSERQNTVASSHTDSMHGTLINGEGLTVQTPKDMSPGNDVEYDGDTIAVIQPPPRRGRGRPRKTIERSSLPLMGVSLGSIQKSSLRNAEPPSSHTQLASGLIDSATPTPFHDRIHQNRGVIPATSTTNINSSTRSGSANVDANAKGIRIMLPVELTPLGVSGQPITFVTGDRILRVTCVVEDVTDRFHFPGGEEAIRGVPKWEALTGQLLHMEDSDQDDAFWVKEENSELKRDD